MAEEIFRKDLYSSFESKYIDIHNSICVSIENVLSKILFDGDLSRMLYSAQDIALRRRLETIPMEKQSPTVVVGNLQLPFCSYCRVGDTEQDDRVASKNAANAIIGQYSTTANHYLRSVAVIEKYKCIVWTSSLREVRLIKDLLNWERMPQNPIKTYVEVKWLNSRLLLPIHINITGIDTNPNYNQRDWLEKARIFPVSVEMDVRSYLIHIPGTEAIRLPLRFSEYDRLEDQEKVYYTESCILAFSEKKFDIDVKPKNEGVKLLETDEECLHKFFEDLSEEQQNELRIANDIPNEFTVDLLKGYFVEDTAVNLNTYKYNNAKTVINEDGTVTAWIDFAIKPADHSIFSKMVLCVPGREPIEVCDCKQRSLTIEGLHQNSEYNCKILTYSLSGDISTFTFKFTTKQDETNLAPSEDNLNKENNDEIIDEGKLPGLLGMTW